MRSRVDRTMRASREGCGGAVSRLGDSFGGACAAFRCISRATKDLTDRTRAGTGNCARRRLGGCMAVMRVKAGVSRATRRVGARTDGACAACGCMSSSTDGTRDGTGGCTSAMKTKTGDCASRRLGGCIAAARVSATVDRATRRVGARTRGACADFRCISRATNGLTSRTRTGTGDCTSRATTTTTSRTLTSTGTSASKGLGGCIARMGVGASVSRSTRSIGACTGGTISTLGRGCVRGKAFRDKGLSK